MVDVAQLVRAPDCDSGGRRFKPGPPPERAPREGRSSLWGFRMTVHFSADPNIGGGLGLAEEVPSLSTNSPIMFFKAPLPLALTELNNPFCGPNGKRPERSSTTFKIGLASSATLLIGWVTLVSMAGPNELSKVVGSVPDQSMCMYMEDLAVPKPPTNEVGNDSKCQY
jgi:hypothetical protein